MKSIRKWIRSRSRRHQLEVVALRLHALDRLMRTTDGPLIDIWDQMRPGLESGLGLTEGSLNSDWDPPGRVTMTWRPEGWR